MKFLLTSIYANVAERLPELVNDEPKNTTVAFIATAADVYEDKSFVELDRNKLIQQGFKIKDIEIKSKTSAELEQEVADCSVIFVAGGNTFFLLQEVRKSGFDDVLNKRLATDTVYVGSSAGSVLIGPNIGLIAPLDDPQDAPDLKNYTGLNLINFVILPHYGKAKYEEKYQKIESEAAKLGIRTKTLKDNEYLIV